MTSCSSEINPGLQNVESMTMGFSLVTRMRCLVPGRSAVDSRALPISLAIIDLGCGDLRYVWHMLYKKGVLTVDWSGHPYPSARWCEAPRSTTSFHQPWVDFKIYDTLL